MIAPNERLRPVWRPVDLDVEDNLGDQAILLTVAGECDFVQVPHVAVQH